MNRSLSLGRACALLVLTLATYLPVLRAGFIWDDEAYVTQNAVLKSDHGLKSIWTDPRATPQYYPLVHTTYWLEYRLWGLNPSGYHAVNLALHAINVFLLWTILSRWSVPGAWLAAALFALHPVHVESVAWITERKNVLSAFFYLLAWLSWTDFDNTRKRSHYVLALCFFALALLSKTVACTFPAAMLVVAWWRHGKIAWRDVYLLVPFFCVGAIAGFVTAFLEQVHVGASGAAWDFSLIDRCLIAGRAVCFYLGKLVFPVSLSFIYPRWVVDAHTVTAYLFPAAVVAGLVACWIKRNAWGRAPLAASLFFIGTLFPALGFFNVYPMKYSFVADHFQYVASIGPLVLIAGALSTLVPALWRPVAATAILCALVGLTFQRTLTFHDQETLWRDTLAKNPACWMAHNNLGLLLAGDGRGEEAMQEYKEAIALTPESEETLTNIGTLLAEQGHLDEAASYHRRALKSNPSYAKAYNNLGIALARKGQIDEAIRNFNLALSFESGDPDAWINLGNAAFMHGDEKRAAVAYGHALKLNPDAIYVANNLAWLFAASSDATLRRPPAAVQLAERIAASPDGLQPGFLDTLAAAYAAAGRFEEAVRTARTGMDLAQKSGKQDLAGKIGKRLSLYETGKSYVEPSRVKP